MTFPVTARILINFARQRTCSALCPDVVIFVCFKITTCFVFKRIIFTSLTVSRSSSFPSFSHYFHISNCALFSFFHTVFPFLRGRLPDAPSATPTIKDVLLHPTFSLHIIFHLISLASLVSIIFFPTVFPSLRGQLADASSPIPFIKGILLRGTASLHITMSARWILDVNPC